ncbi:MAG: DUF58 domain-containing protein, partial [Catenulispora sp.]
MTLLPAPRLLVAAGAVAAASLALLALPEVWPLIAAGNLLVAAAALLDLALTPGPSKLSAERFTAGRLALLREEPVTLRVRNDGRAALRVRLRDTPPEAFRASAEELAGPVPAHAESAFRYAVTPLRRGRFAWGPVHLRYRSLLGLWERGRVVPAEAAAAVYPNLEPLDHYRLLAIADKLETVDARPVRPRGASMEFESLRDYAAGDDVRKLDWKASARRGKLIVRTERAERNQTVLILVDSGRLMTAEENGVAKIDHAVNAALLLTHVALARGDRVGLCTFSNQVHAWLAPRGGPAQGRLIAESLFDLRADYRETDHARALQLLAARHPKRALVVVLTDFVDATTAADLVAHLGLAARRHLVLLAALKDPFLERAARSEPAAERDGYRKAVAVELLHERQEVLERIRHLGGLVIDAEPAGIAPPLLNRYLEVALRG